MLSQLNLLLYDVISNILVNILYEKVELNLSHIYVIITILCFLRRKFHFMYVSLVLQIISFPFSSVSYYIKKSCMLMIR